MATVKKATRGRVMSEKEADRIAVLIADRLGNGESKLDKRLTLIETGIAVIKEQILHPCAKHEDVIRKITAMETRQSLLYPTITAVIGGAVVGIITLFARYFIK